MMWASETGGRGRNTVGGAASLQVDSAGSQLLIPGRSLQLCAHFCFVLQSNLRPFLLLFNWRRRCTVNPVYFQPCVLIMNNCYYLKSKHMRCTFTVVVTLLIRVERPCLIRGRGTTTEPTVNWDHVRVFSRPTFPRPALEGVLTAREVRLDSRSRLDHLLSTEPALGNIYLTSVSNSNIGFTSSFSSSFLCLSHFL